VGKRAICGESIRSDPERKKGLFSRRSKGREYRSKVFALDVSGVCGSVFLKGSVEFAKIVEVNAINNVVKVISFLNCDNYIISKIVIV